MFEYLTSGAISYTKPGGCEGKCTCIRRIFRLESMILSGDNFVYSCFFFTNSEMKSRWNASRGSSAKRRRFTLVSEAICQERALSVDSESFNLKLENLCIWRNCLVKSADMPSGPSLAKWPIKWPSGPVAGSLLEYSCCNVYSSALLITSDKRKNIPPIFSWNVLFRNGFKRQFKLSLPGK